jgi:hypothetical protein
MHFVIAILATFVLVIDHESSHTHRHGPALPRPRVPPTHRHYRPTHAPVP